MDGESIFYYSSTNEWTLPNEWILMNTVRNLQNATEEANNWDQRIGIFKQDDLLNSNINQKEGYVTQEISIQPTPEPEEVVLAAMPITIQTSQDFADEAGFPQELS